MGHAETLPSTGVAGLNMRRRGGGGGRARAVAVPKPNKALAMFVLPVVSVGFMLYASLSSGVSSLLLLLFFLFVRCIGSDYDILFYYTFFFAVIMAEV